VAVATIQFMSKALGRRVTYTALLPETGEGPYKLVYMLHGKSDDHRAWLYYSNLERYARSLPLVVVMPDGGTSFWMNAGERERYEDFVIQDLDEHVRRTFHIAKGKVGIGGLSMGGYGAMRYALRYPERFGSVWSHSGAFLTKEEFAERGFASEDADIRVLAEQCDPDALGIISFDCGREDFLIEHNRSLHRLFEELGIKHNYYEHEGAHTWEYWDLHVREALAQHVQVL